MGKIYEFSAELIGDSKVDGAYIVFPYDIREAFGTEGIVKVEATFDGYVYRGILAKMGCAQHIIGVTQEIKKIIGKQVGDEISVTITQDTASRLKEVPDSLKIALNEDDKAKDFFDSLTESQKNKFITYMTSAKKEQTIKARKDKIIEMLNNKQKMK